MGDSEKKVLNFDEEIAAKLAAKQNPEDIKKAAEWLQAVSGSPMGPDFLSSVKNGVVLCQAMLKLSPGCISSASWTPRPKHYLDNMANVKAFLNAAAVFGVESGDLFSERDLGDLKADIFPVVNCIFALSRTAQSKRIPGVPVLGPNYYRSEEDNARIKARKEAEYKQLAEQKQKIDEERRVRREELESEIQEQSQTRIGAMESRQKRRAGTRQNKGIGGRISPARKPAEAELQLQYGFDKEHRDQMRAKFVRNNADLAEAVMNWIEEITLESVDDFQLHLKSGRTLCRLVNKINAIAGDNVLISDKKINGMRNKMKETANLEFFLDSLESFGIPRKEMFGPTDLYDSKDLAKVTRVLQILVEKTSGSTDTKYATLPPFVYVERKPETILDPALAGRRAAESEKKKSGARIHMEEAMSLFVRGQFLDAIRAFDAVIHLDREHSEALFHRGKSLRIMGRHQEAFTSLNKAIAAQPDHLDAMIEKAGVLVSLERYDEAITGYDEILAMELTPELREAIEGLKLEAIATKNGEVVVPVGGAEPGGSWLRTGALLIGGVAVGAALCYVAYTKYPEKVAEAKNSLMSWWFGPEPK